MKRVCRQEHAAWLEPLLVEGPDAAPQEVLKKIQNCPLCAPEFTDLARLQASFDQVGRDQREALEAARVAGSDEEEFVRHALERQVAFSASEAPQSTSRRPHRPRLLGIVVGLASAAALLLILSRAFRDEASDPEPRETVLSPWAVQILAPKGEVKRFDIFRWHDPEGNAADSRIRVFAREDGGRVQLLERVLEGHELAVTATEREAWPERIEWSLEILDRSGRVVSTVWTEAWLGPR